MRREQFRRVFDCGIQVVGRPAVVYTVPNELEVSRLGIVVSSRIGRAAARNRVRRRLREWARRSWHRVRPGHDIVIVGRRATREMSYPGFAAEMARLFSALQLWGDEGEDRCSQPGPVE